MVRSIRDANLLASIALPNGAATVNSPGIDLENSSKADQLVPFDFLIEAPALTVGQLANAATMKYSLQCDTDPAFGTVQTYLADVLTQTGAAGAGAAAATRRVALPSDANQRYWRLRAINSGAGDCSAVAAKLSALF